MSIYSRHAEFELRNLWTRYGYFNLFVLAILPFWLPIHWLPNCRDPSHGVGTYILFILLVAGVAIGLESRDRIRTLELPAREWSSSLAISFIRNLAGFPLYFVWIALPHARLFHLGLIVACVPWIWLSRLLIYPEKPSVRPNHWSFTEYLGLAGLYGCGLLFLVVLLPNFIGTGGCSGISSVKGQIHTFQTMVEAYALGHGGKYPQQLAELEADGKKKGYWKDLGNPWGRVSERCRDQLHGTCAYLLMSDYPKDMPESLPEPHRFDYLVGLPIVLSTGPVDPYDWAGLVLYEPVSAIRYYIYGTTKKGLLIKDKGQAYYVTNS